MGKLVNLLKWKKPLLIKDKTGKIVKDADGNPVTVYLRVVGDHDIDEAQKTARLASAKLRAKLLDKESDEYIINISIFDDATKEICKELILQAQGATLASEAYAETVIPELPELEEFALNPDAPTLEELEQLDKAIDEGNTKYKAELATYIKDHLDILAIELEEKTIEELRDSARESMIIIMAIDLYINTLRDEKVWRAVYEEEDYATQSFKSIDEYNNLDLHIKEQLREEYARLEEGLDDLKN